MINPGIVLHAGKIVKLYTSKEDLNPTQRAKMLREAKLLIAALPDDHASRMSMVKTLAGLLPAE